MTSYKTCAVPMCISTTIKYPSKLFIHVPKCSKRRKQWLQLARRDPKFTSDKSAIFFCEDHFDLPNDMENYIQYSVMGSVGKIRMKPDCLPLKFQCQPDRIKRTLSPQPRSAVSKRRRIEVMQKIFSMETEMTATSGMRNNSDFQSTAEKDDCPHFQDQATQVSPETTNKIIQVCLSAKIRSKTLQTSRQNKEESTCPLKTDIKTAATSPLKIKTGVELARNHGHPCFSSCNPQRTMSGLQSIKEEFLYEVKIEPQEVTDVPGEEQLKKYYSELYVKHEIKEELVVGPVVLQSVPLTEQADDGMCSL